MIALLALAAAAYLLWAAGTVAYALLRVWWRGGW